MPTVDDRARSDDEAIRTLVTRLSRPHPSGGHVVERSALLADGADFTAIMAWIVAHAGEPEVLATSRRGGGLHGARVSGGHGATTQNPLRFILPAGALSA